MDKLWKLSDESREASEGMLEYFRERAMLSGEYADKLAVLGKKYKDRFPERYSPLVELIVAEAEGTARREEGFAVGLTEKILKPFREVTDRVNLTQRKVQ